LKRKEKKKKKPKELLEAVRANRMVYVLISPFFILYAIFGLYPMVYSFLLSFFKWSGSGEKEFVGFLNYQYLFKDAVFLKSVVNTLIIWCLSTIPMVILALIFAFILNLGTLKCKSVFRAVYFLPNVTSTVAVAIVFATMFASNYGLVNFLLTSLGMDPVKWMSVPFWVQFVIALVVMWRWTGYNAIIALAGLQKIPSDLYEAARIDGASNWQIFCRITIPLLNPTIIFIIVTSTIGGWQLMEESYMLVGKAGGIAKSGMTVVLYLYNKAFLERQFGYGSAVSWGLFVIICAFSFLNWKLVQRDTE
jgi:cellobiose transport system permease protein